jgi:hypothetical protein
MSDVLNFLKSVNKLMEKRNRFATMGEGEKSAFRGHLTRLINEAAENNASEVVVNALNALKEEIGEPEVKRERMSLENVLAEFADYEAYDTRKRGAYKGKITRFIEEALKEGDKETEVALLKLQSRIHKFEQDEQTGKLYKLLHMQKRAD